MNIGSIQIQMRKKMIVFPLKVSFPPFHDMGKYLLWDEIWPPLILEKAFYSGK